MSLKPYYGPHEGITIYHGDCREILPQLKINVLITDPPYGITDHAWDKPVAPEEWMLAPCVAFAAEPFATSLISTAPLVFRYDLVWIKNTASNTLNAATQPLRSHERVLIFGAVGYYVQMVQRTPREMARLNQRQREANPSRFPSTVLDFPAVNNRNGDRTKHPSQKPLALLKWLVASYSMPHSVVVDPFMGSGTTLRAAKDLGRKAIGIEIEERYCEIAALRLSQSVIDFPREDEKPRTRIQSNLLEELGREESAQDR